MEWIVVALTIVGPPIRVERFHYAVQGCAAALLWHLHIHPEWFLACIPWPQ